ncbi:hypothetical protein LZ554_003680 [Drepanopeziza brunnea f. sp. 'monogermtubi']|nr:hypothetical protein LZ554_003680 [Drepanopeziza brunnea f. sp. 'monogermtubi']
MNFLIQDNEPATTVKPGIPVVVVSSIAEKQEHDTNAGEGEAIFQRVDDLEEIKQPVDDQENEKLGDNGKLYGISKFEKVEDVQYYTEDGFHPVSIGDNFKDGKYRIVHKLGNGAFATVWLAHDVEEERYVAIKIALADFSKKFSDVSLKIFHRIQEYIDRGKSAKFIDLPIENFWVDGPNGCHFCTVSRFLGPSITAVTQNKCYVDTKSCQRMGLQLAQTLAILHSAEMEIVHGDLTSANVLLELESIDSWSVEKLYEELGAPNGDRVYAYNGRVLGSEAPKFLYEAADLTRLLGRRTGNIRVIDFGESFFVDNSPEEGVGTPADFRSPELLLENKCGKGSDIWALALTVFELRLQSRLFRSFVFPDSEERYATHFVDFEDEENFKENVC